MHAPISLSGKKDTLNKVYRIYLYISRAHINVRVMRHVDKNIVVHVI